MNNFLPNIDPKISTLSAVIIGFALIGDLTANEQNAFGNWFITIGQILENNSAFQQVIESRVTGSNININSDKCKRTGNPYNDNKAWINDPDKDELEKIKQVINKVQEQIDSLMQ